MMSSEKKIHLHMLLQALQLLAASYEQQSQSLPTFVHIPDEIALLFNDTYAFMEELLREDLIPVAAVDQLKQLDTVLDHMSEEKVLWTLQVLETAPPWEKVRSLAASILDSFHEPRQPPDLFWVQYIPGRKFPAE
jgi:hypothetical protein